MKLVQKMWMRLKLLLSKLNLANLTSDTVFVWRRGYNFSVGFNAPIQLEKGKIFERR